MKCGKSEKDIGKLPLEDLIRRAEAGDSAAQGLLGRKYHFGDGVVQNSEKALNWAQRAAQQGDFRGQALIGYYHIHGILLDQDYEKSHYWYLLSASQGYAPALYMLGQFYYLGVGVEKNLELATSWHLRAARKGDTDSGLKLVELFEKQNDFQRSFYWAKKVAERGNALAQGLLSVKYHLGKGVRRNNELAFHWAEQAAKQGHAWGQMLLGQFYMQGVGHPQDLALSRRWFQRSARQGYAGSMYWLGAFYDEGRGVRKNGTRAKSWFLRSAELDDPCSQMRLAMILDRKPGGYAQAHPWYEKAATQGVAEAQYTLFWTYMGSTLGAPDFERAYYWIDLAATAGHKGAIAEVAKLDEFTFVAPDFNIWVGLPAELKIPMRHRTFLLLGLVKKPLYRELLEDLRRYVAANPVGGRNFTTDTSWLEMMVAGGEGSNSVRTMKGIRSFNKIMAKSPSKSHSN